MKYSVLDLAGLGGVRVGFAMRLDYQSKYQELGALIAGARRKAGLSQEELAEKLDRSQAYVSKMERGARKLDVLEFLEVANAVGVDPMLVLRQLIPTKRKR